MNVIDALCRACETPFGWLGLEPRLCRECRSMGYPSVAVALEKVPTPVLPVLAEVEQIMQCWETRELAGVAS